MADTEYHWCNNGDNGNCDVHPNKRGKHSNKPTVSTISHQPNKPSNECGYPVKSTWLKAIKAGNYVGWPMLNERNVQKYYLETIETAKGHLNQTRKNVRSTKAKTLPLETCDSSQLHGKKVRDVYTETYMVHETMFSHQTGQFLTHSQQGNKYIMVMVEIDSNAILVEPMKSRKDEEMIHAYNALLL